MPTPPKRICFVTGTRAEFGLMRSTLNAIRAHSKLQLQLVVTGMHLHRRHGRTIDDIRRDGWSIDATVPWPPSPDAAALARQSGLAMARLAATFERLRSDVALVVGDRVEAFAAASAAAVGQRIVAHVHGGDRAAGQIDDALRHAITKLAHVHFPATPGSAQRIVRLGEDGWRVHQVGAPGIDGIASLAAPTKAFRARFPNLPDGAFALVALHPTDSSGAAEFERARLTLAAVRSAGVGQVVVVYPNNDPGAGEIIRCWDAHRGQIDHALPDVPRDLFVALMGRCAIMVGNSSAGIIEAGALGTPVVNVGDRQAGREHGRSVVDVPFDPAAIAQVVRRAVLSGRTAGADKTHPYGGGGAGRKIAQVLAGLRIDDRLLRKLIAY